MKLTNFLRVILPVGVVAAVSLSLVPRNAASAQRSSTITSLRVTQDGAFVPFGFDFAQPPQVYVRNGKWYQPGVVPAIYPGPAMLPIFEAPISSRGLRAISNAARTAGLLSKAPDYGFPGVADVPTTTITIVAGRNTYVHRIYALGFDSDLPNAQRARRAKISAFLAAVGDANSSVLKGTIGTQRQYAGDRIRILPFPLDLASAGEGAQVKLWPVQSVPLVGEKCIGVEGSTVAAIRRAIESGNSATLWESASKTYRLNARLVLPGEPLCP